MTGTVTTSTNHAFTGVKSMMHNEGANYLKLNTLPQPPVNIRAVVYYFDLIGANFEETVMVEDDGTDYRMVGVMEHDPNGIDKYMFRLGNVWNAG